MIVLGLGSNFGNRKKHLREAIREIDAAGVNIKKISPLYESDAQVLPGAPPEWQLPFFNLALLCETSLAPQALLKTVKSIEQRVGRTQRERWAPREIDIDILAWGDEQIQSEELRVPHAHLWNRPFALLPLSDVAPLWRDPTRNNSSPVRESVRSLWPELSERPFKTRRSLESLSEFVAILNLTPDSFSDGGQFMDIQKAVTHAERVIRDGASVIDIGAESTRPGATTISVEEESRRLLPVLAELRKCFPHMTLSVDTRKAPTARLALKAGADWINDVSGLNDPQMRQVMSQNPQAKIVAMHHEGVPPQPSLILDPSLDPVWAVILWGERKLEELSSAGISAQQIMMDPGIGFGKTTAQSFEVLCRVAELRVWRQPLFVGHSRKAFLKLVGAGDEASQRDFETAAISAQLAAQTVDYIRVHAVDSNVHTTRTLLRTMAHTHW